MNQPSRRERWKVRVLKTPSLSHGTRLFLVHTLAKYMKADGFVSRPRWKLASEAGISERQVTRYMSNAVETGWLNVIQAGYRTMTAEYEATFPNPNSGTQDVSLSEPGKGDANGPSLEVTNTSPIHAGKRDVGRPTTSSTTTRPLKVVSIEHSAGHLFSSLRLSLQSGCKTNETTGWVSATCASFNLGGDRAATTVPLHLPGLSSVKGSAVRSLSGCGRKAKAHRRGADFPAAGVAACRAGLAGRTS